MEIAKNKTILKKSDIIKIQQLSLLKSSWIVFIFAAALVLMAFRIIDGQFVFKSVFFAVVGGCVVPGYFIIAEIMLFRRRKKIPTESIFEFVFTEKHLTATDLSSPTPDSENLDYSNITSYKIEKKYIFITACKDALLLVDKKGFESAEDEQKVEKLLALKVKKGKKSKKN